MDNIVFSVFTKAWKEKNLDELGDFVKNMGFDAIEYPLRKGYQVEPDEGEKGLVRLVNTLKKHGVGVSNIAGDITFNMSDGTYEVSEETKELFYGCSKAGIKIIRICQGIDKNKGFFQNIDEIKNKYDLLLPLCKKYNVKIGVQMHCNWNIFNSAQVYLLIKDYDPNYISAIWDSGHWGLTGTKPEISLDILWDRLCMINFKAAYYKRTNGPESEETEWTSYWTDGRHSLGSWKSAAEYLKNRKYKGIICLSADYTDVKNTDRYILNDINYIKELFKG